MPASVGYNQTFSGSYLNAACKTSREGRFEMAMAGMVRQKPLYFIDD